MRARDRIAAWLCTAALAIAALAIGGAPRWGALLAAAAGLACALPYVRSTRRLARPAPLLVLLGLAAAVTALQLVPLPIMLVRALSSLRADAAVGNAQVLGVDPPGWIALSMDPAATLVELAKLLGYLGFAYTALRVAERRGGPELLLRAVALVGAGVALVAAAHYAAGASQLFGVYEPERNVLGFIAPILNPNHLAALLVVATCAALGMALAKKRLPLLWLAIAGGTFALAILQRSRGGIVALGVGVAGTLLLWWLARRRQSSRAESGSLWLRTVPSLIIAACAVALIIAFTASGVAAELANTESAEVSGEEGAGKVVAWRASVALLRDFKLTGVGRGAFEPSFTRVRVPDGDRVYSHVENEYLQAVIDWGWPASMLLLLAVVWLGVHASRRARRGPVEAAAAGALVALALHNIADFNLELPALAMPAIVFAAILGRIPLAKVSRSVRVPAPWQRGAALAAGLALVLVAAGPWARSARADREAIEAAGDTAGVLEAAHAAMRRHPADFYAPAAAGQALLDARDGRAAAYINRALLLNPHHAGLHRLAARMLLAAGQPQQACLEYRLALRVELDPRELVDEVLARITDDAQAADCLPAESLRGTRPLVVMIDQVRRRGRPAVAREVAEVAVASHPDDAGLARRLGELEHELGNLAAAEGALRVSLGLDGDPSTALALARVLFDTDRLAEAVELIERSARETALGRAKFNLLTALADEYARRGRLEEARATLASAIQKVGHDRKLRASLHGRLAKVEAALGNSHRAEWERRQARELLRP